MPTLKASPAQLLGAVLAIAALCAPAAAQDPDAPEAPPAVPEGDGQAILVIDASNSMWGQIDGVAKIEIAREAVSGLLDRWNPEVELGVMAYGHRREGDCTDIELVAPVGAERPVVDAALASLTPRGKTPMTDAVAQAAEALSHADRPATVILVSDGRETCNADPCAVASELERSGVAFTAHVVGFDVADEETIAQLQCIAENTGGRYVAADSAEELSVALVETGGAAAAEPEPAPEPTAQPSVTLEAPEQAVMGSSFVVAWSASEQNPDDYVTIVPAGADEGTYEDYARVRDDNEASLQAPAEPGLYEVRYVLEEGRVTLASADIEIVEAETSVSAPESATAGSAFDVSWTNVIHPDDYVTIVPAGAEEGTYEDYARVRDDNEASLQAPAEPGLYEVRYVLKEGRVTLASTDIEIVEAETSVSAPESATAGSAFDVSWTNVIHPDDYVTIVPAGADEGTYEDYARVRDDNEASLQAPAEPGLYEVRYVLKEGRVTLASADIEIVEAETSVSAPESATAGSAFGVSWTNAIHPDDYVTIVPAGAEEGTYENYARVRDDNEASLQAPAEPGLYEVRYVLKEGRVTLASADIEIVETDIEISGPDTVRAESEIRVSWSGTVPSPTDFVTIVPMGAEEGEYTDYERVRDTQEADLPAPQNPGLYELRYVLDEGRRTIARHPVEVVAATAQLDAGGSLDAPESGVAGETIEIGWSAEENGNDRRVALARPDQADFTWIDARAADAATLSFTLPETPGTYEFRLLDITARDVLSRAIIEVE